MDKSKQELCTIRIMFPVVSDELAINYKKLITDILKDNSDANIQFSIMSMPSPSIRPNLNPES